MSFEEKQTWASALIGIAAYGAYVAAIFHRAGDAPLHTVSYAAPMLMAMGAVIASMIAFNVIDRIAARVGHEYAASRGEHVQTVSRREYDQKDERDIQIFRYGQTIGYGVQSVAFLTILGMVVYELPYFWIGQALFFSCFLELAIKSAAKICAYRRGFQQW